jgi:hypothetical protein
MAMTLARQITLAGTRKTLDDPYKYGTPGLLGYTTLPVTRWVPRTGAPEGTKVGVGTP